MLLLIALLLSPPSPVVATLGAQEIRQSDLDSKVGAQLRQAKQEYQKKLYELRSQVLNGLIDEQLLKAEAQKRGLKNIEALLEAEWAGLEVQEEKIKAFYEEHKEQMQGRSFEEIKEQIKGFLSNQVRREKLGALTSKLRGAAQLKIFLEPPRVKIKAEGFSKGPKEAPVTLITFLDYECPYCAQAAVSAEKVQAMYPKKLRLVAKDFPLGFHQRAMPAAIAARCAGRQGKFWEMHAALFKSQSDLSDARIEAIVKEQGLDLAAWTQCKADPSVQAAIKADQADGAQAGVSGTPAFFINGIMIGGAQSPEALKEIIERELIRLKSN